MHNWGLLMVVDCGRPTRLQLGSCRNTRDPLVVQALPRITHPALLGPHCGGKQGLRGPPKAQGLIFPPGPRRCEVEGGCGRGLELWVLEGTVEMTDQPGGKGEEANRFGNKHWRARRVGRDRGADALKDRWKCKQMGGETTCQTVCVRV